MTTSKPDTVGGIRLPETGGEKETETPAGELSTVFVALDESTMIERGYR